MAADDANANASDEEDEDAADRRKTNVADDTTTTTLAAAAAAATAAAADPNAPKRLFVGGIANATQEDFHAYWSKFGETVSCEVVRSGDGRSRGFGFISFAAPEHAAAALDEEKHAVNGATWVGSIDHLALPHVDTWHFFTGHRN